MILPLLLCLVFGSNVHWLGPKVRSPNRIVSLAPSLTELLFALGSGKQVAGVTRFDNYPPEAKMLPKVGGFVDPDPESIAVLKPDLVITVPTSGGKMRVHAVARLGFSVLVLPNATLQDFWTALKQLGYVLHQHENATHLEASLRKQLRSIQKQHQPFSRLRVLIIVGLHPITSAGPNTYLDALLAHVRAQNIITTGPSYPHVDLETILASSPDVIVDLSEGTQVQKQNFWSTHQALLKEKNIRLQIIEHCDELVRPGPRLMEGLQKLANALRPAGS